LLSDWDTVGIGNGQNAYLYYAPIEGRHYLLPWDMDHTFETSDVPIAPPPSTEGFGRIVSRPAFRRLYASILKEQSETSWSDAHVSSWVQMVNETGTPAGVNPGANITSFIAARRNQVLAYIKSGTGVQFEVTSPDPSGFPSASGPVTGTAPIGVDLIYTVLDRGAPQRPAIVWTPPPRQPSAIPTNWQLAVEGLIPGENSVEFLALDHAGNLLGSRTIRVYNTSGWAPPVLESVNPTSGATYGGTEVTVRGTGFREHFTVKVGGASASSPVFVSETEIRAVTPAGTEGPADVEVTNLGGEHSVLGAGFLYVSSTAGEFVRGDVDGVPGINATDVRAILDYLFASRDVACLDAADANDDGKINVSDAIVLILYLFGGRGPLPEPAGTPGGDPTPDSLGCAG